MTLVPDSSSPTQVLTLDAVDWSIRKLSSRSVHPYFLAYLQLRRRWVSDSGELIDPRWNDLVPLLALPGGPPNKPYYRPLMNRSTRDGSAYWLNANLAGSFAPSSLRRTAAFLVDGDRFVLPVNHADIARDRFLEGKPISALALGGYFLRNFGFVFDGAGGPEQLVQGVRNWFRFDSDDQQLNSDFELLFETEVPAEIGNWFEPLEQPGEVDAHE